MCSLVPRPSPQLSSLAVRITLLSVIRTASDDSCGEGLGTRLAGVIEAWIEGLESWESERDQGGVSTAGRSRLL